MNARQNQDPESIVRDIRRKTRRKFTSEEKIRIVLEGLKGEASISDLCRREGIVNNPRVAHLSGGFLQRCTISTPMAEAVGHRSRELDSSIC